MNNPVLMVDKLTVYHETYLAVDQVSFSLEEGTDMAIIGPNGAGKSTLIQSILGILHRQNGDVFILGQPLSHSGYLPNYVRREIAYLPQNFMFDRRIPITVQELVGLGWDKLGLQLPWVGSRSRYQAIRQALIKVDAWNLRHHLIGGLSGGEMKRVLLAYCVVRPRRLLILDEALAGLDVQGELDFYQLLYQLKKEEGWAILQISHDLDQVKKHCDRVLCLNRMVLSEGTPETILSPENISIAYGSQLRLIHTNNHHINNQITG